MVQCLQRYDWVKLLRSHLPEGKGVMGAWAKLASRAAFRKGNAYYCGFSNPVEPGMWAGGVVGLKSILGAKKRHQALQTMERLHPECKKTNSGKRKLMVAGVAAAVVSAVLLLIFVL